MATLLERFKFLKSRKENVNELQGYLSRITGSGKYFKLKQNTVLLPDESNKKWILLKKKLSSESKAIYICLRCSDIGALHSVHNNISLHEITKNYCLHASMSFLFWGDSQSEVQPIDNNNEAIIEKILEEKGKYYAVVHPDASKNKPPGVVGVTNKTKRPRCIFPCKGEDCCIHLRIHNETFKDQQKIPTSRRATKKDEVEVVAHTKLKESSESDPDALRMKFDQKNEVNKSDLDPFSFDGEKANVFKIKINFPPTKEEENKLKKISARKNPFPTTKLIPEYLPNEKCSCGNSYDPQSTLTNKDSEKIYIHHTHEVYDSRKGNFIVLYRPTVSPQK